MGGQPRAKGMMDMEDRLRAHLLRFIEQNTPESYRELLEVVRASRHYNPYSDVVSEASDLLENGEFQKAVDYLHDRMDNCILSPRCHQLMCIAYDKLGDADGAAVEAQLAYFMLEGILGTGDGSETRPYLVSRTEDEYDVLSYLEKTPQMQSLVERSGRKLDRQQCKDGSTIWFDVTEQLAHLNQMLEQPAPKKPWQFWRR